MFFCFPRASGSGSGGEVRQGCPQGQSGGPFRVPVCLAHEGRLSPLSTAFHAAAGLAHATRNVARGIVRFGAGVGLPQRRWPILGAAWSDRGRGERSDESVTANSICCRASIGWPSCGRVEQSRADTERKAA